jgi:hypothetical protein
MFFVRCGKYGILMADQHHVGIENAQDYSNLEQR